MRDTTKTSEGSHGRPRLSTGDEIVVRPDPLVGFVVGGVTGVVGPVTAEKVADTPGSGAVDHRQKVLLKGVLKQ